MTSLVIVRRNLLLGACALAAGCRAKKQDEPTQVPSRIVSLTPNTTEAVFAIGAGSKLVGRSRYCDHPPEVKRLPVVGGYVDPSLEAILGLRPDLVVGARGPAGTALVERLQTHSIRTYFPRTESIAEIREMLLGLGQLLALSHHAREVVNAIDHRLSALDQVLAQRPRPRVLLVFGLSPIVVAGPGSFPDEMLRRAGADNVMQSGTHYPTLGIETVISLRPSIIIDAAVAEGHGAQRITVEQPGWSSVQAVQRGAVFAIEHDSVLRPGPRVAEGVTRLASVAHPGVKLP